jgi:hypothetical protein
MITTKDLLMQSGNILNYHSTIRDGQVRKLMLGEVAIFDTKVPLLVSTRDGSMVAKPYWSSPIYDATGRIPLDGSSLPEVGRVSVDTFVIAKRFDIIPDDPLNTEKMKREFQAYEVSQVMKRIKNADDVVYAPDPEIKRLQKFFDDVGKNVAVLSTGKIVELGKDFTLIVRSEPSMETMTDTTTGLLHVVLWEDIGFTYDMSAT